MKRFRPRFIFMAGFLVIGAASVVLYSCGGGGGGGGGGGTSTTPIANAAQGGAAAGAGTAGATAGTGLSDVASSLGSIGGNSLGLSLPGKPMNPLTAKDPKLSKMVAAAQKVAKSKAVAKVATHLKAAKAKSKAALAAVPISNSGACTDGGTYDFTGTIDDTTGAFDFTMTFSSCREGGEQSDGPMDISGSFDAASANFTMTLGDTSTDLVVQTYNDTTYGSLLGIFSTSMAMTEIYSFDANPATPDTLILTANGAASFDDYTVVPLQAISLTMTNFTDTATFTAAASSSTYMDTLGGSVSESWMETVNNVATQHSAAVSFTGFNTTAVEAGDGSEDFSLAGTVKVDFTPDADCGIEGTFTFVTNAPLHTGPTDSCPVSGQLTINGNTTVDFGVAAHGTSPAGHVDVTVGSDVTHYDSCHDLEGLCEVEDFQSSGGQTSGGGGTSTSGNGMLVTLTWNDDTTDQSDMDLHVGYYIDSSPTTGPADALVAWHSSGDIGCSIDHTPVAFGTAIAQLDFDDCDGLGPEHVTVDGLPAGYYVIAVDSYGLHGSASATVNVSVTIGGTIYTFDPHTFTTFDSDGTDTNSWYRVTDLQCATAGNCTFVTPNTALQVHDTAGNFKPRLKK